MNLNSVIRKVCYMSNVTGYKGRRGNFRRRPYHVAFGILALVVTAVVFGILYLLTAWHPYWSWILALSVTTFGLILLDKILAKAGNTRIPEVVLHLCTLLGGFPGQLIARVLVRHKTNVSRHPTFLIVLVVSALIHGLLAYYWFFL